MTEKIKMTEMLSEQLRKVILELRQNQELGMSHLAEVLPKVVNIFQELFEMAEIYEDELEIPTDILLQQLQNFEQSYQQHDIVLLADALEYELGESISFYLEILKNMEQK